MHSPVIRPVSSPVNRFGRRTAPARWRRLLSTVRNPVEETP
jgi:hypothetical protein